MVKYKYQAPLTHRKQGPGLILILCDSYPSASPDDGKPHLDPPPAQKWAEEGFCVLSVPASKKVDWKLAIPIIVAALEQAKELENDKNFGVISM